MRNEEEEEEAEEEEEEEDHNTGSRIDTSADKPDAATAVAIGLADGASNSAKVFLFLY